MFQGDFLCPGGADIARLTGRTSGGSVGKGDLLAGGQQVEVVDGHLRQILSLEHGQLIEDIADQSSLALGDAVVASHILQVVVRNHLLGDHRTAEAVQGGVDLIGEMVGDLHRFLMVVTFHSEQNGVGKFAQVAVLHHRADDGIGGDIHIHTLELHILQNDFSVLIERFGGNNPLCFVDPQLNAGVDIHLHRIVESTVAVPPEQTADHHAGSCSQGQHLDPVIVAAAGIGYILHIQDLSFRFLGTVGQDAVENIRCQMFRGSFQFLFHRIVSHL